MLNLIVQLVAGLYYLLYAVIIAAILFGACALVFFLVTGACGVYDKPKKKDRLGSTTMTTRRHR